MNFRYFQPRQRQDPALGAGGTKFKNGSRGPGSLLDGCIKDLLEINLGTSSYRIFGETVVFVGKFGQISETLELGVSLSTL